MKITTDGKHVMEVFKFHDESGLPWEIIGLELKSKNMVPDWQEFMRGAIRSCWKPETIFSAAKDMAGPLGFANDPEWMNRLKLLFCEEMRAIK